MLNRENCTPAELAHKLGVSRTRVTQILRLLRLAPDVLQKIAELGDPLPTPIITERTLRPVAGLNSAEQQRWITTVWK
jgi:transcriptional regulator with XRE-family HTH domain